MAIFKCKMCGGSLSVQDRATVAECEYCGTTQTIPTSTDEVIVQYFNRANYLRQKSEYDKAAEVYEKILDLDNTQAEAHWGVVLCKYGVEYVEDPLTKERIPTCHRTQMTSLLTDADYQAVLQYADSASRAVYKEQAEAINELQKKILQIVKSEKPFDVFICYKETDESGARTKDSVIANEIYHELTNSGLKVFFAAITLEDKLGQEYEPYIFAALTSAKVMLVLGTKTEYFNAVWVKNEWSRYLHLMKTDRQIKRTLIPCFRDMDAYDLPDEFSHIQALNMSSIAFMPDLVRNVSRLIGRYQNVGNSVTFNQSNLQIAPLLKRAFMFLEDGEFERADELLEEVLNRDPENAKAYMGKFMVTHQISVESNISDNPYCLLNKNGAFQKACKFADEEYKQNLFEYIYNGAKKLKSRGIYVDAARLFAGTPGYIDADEQRLDCLNLENQRIYDSAIEQVNSGSFLKASKIFETIRDYKDSTEWIERCFEYEYQPIYDSAIKKLESGSYAEAYSIFNKIRHYKDSKKMARYCQKCEKQRIYEYALSLAKAKNYSKAKSELLKIRGFRNSDDLIVRCDEEIENQKRKKRNSARVRYTAINSIITIPVCAIITGIIGGIICGFNSFFPYQTFNYTVFTIFIIVGAVIGFLFALMFGWDEEFIGDSNK